MSAATPHDMQHGNSSDIHWIPAVQVNDLPVPVLLRENVPCTKPEIRCSQNGINDHIYKNIKDILGNEL